VSASLGDTAPWWFLYSRRVDLDDDERATYAKVHSHGLDLSVLARSRGVDVRDVQHELASAEAKVKEATGEVVPA